MVSTIGGWENSGPLDRGVIWGWVNRKYRPCVNEHYDLIDVLPQLPARAPSSRTASLAPVIDALLAHIRACYPLIVFCVIVIMLLECECPSSTSCPCVNPPSLALLLYAAQSSRPCPLATVAVAWSQINPMYNLESLLYTTFPIGNTQTTFIFNPNSSNYHRTLCMDNTIRSTRRSIMLNWYIPAVGVPLE